MRLSLPDEMCRECSWRAYLGTGTSSVGSAFAGSRAVSERWSREEARDSTSTGGAMNVAVDALARRASGERPSVLRSALAAAVVGGAAAAITYHLLRRSGGQTEAE